MGVLILKEKDFIKSLKEASHAFKHANFLLNTLLANFNEKQLEMVCSLPYSEDGYDMVISEYTTYSGDCSYSLAEIISAMKVDGLLEEG